MPGATRAQLPRGPHGLSREEVAASQRERLLWSMIESVAAKGFVRTTVADVLAGAGVSRATFYQQFADKEDCFGAAYAMGAALVAEALEAQLAAVRADRSEPLERLDRVLGTYLDTLQAAPALARVFLVEVYAAGPAAIEQRRASMERFVDLVVETHAGSDGVLGSAPEQRFAAEVLVGGVSSMVTNLVGSGHADRLADLRAPMVALAARLTGVDPPR